MNSRYKVCALIVTYNRLSLLQETLSSLTKQANLDKILVVDNNSCDGTRHWLKKVANEQIVPLFLPENTGGAGGFYHGLRWIQNHWETEYIWILDDDAYPDEGALALLLEVAELCPEGAGFFPAIYMRCGTPEKYSWPRKDFMPGNIFPLPRYSESEIKEERFLLAKVGPFLGFLLRSYIISEIGFPRPEFFIFYDDFEYTFRISQKRPLYFVPQASFKHHVRPPDFKGIKSYYFFRNWTYLSVYYGNHGLGRSFLCWLKWRFGLSFFRKQKISDKWAWRGILDGVKGRLGKLIV